MSSEGGAGRRLTRVRDGDLVEAVWVDGTCRNFLNSPERLCHVEAAAAAVANSNCDILQDDEAPLVLEGLILHALGANGAPALLASVAETLHSSVTL